MRQHDPWTADELASFLAAARGGRLEAAWHLAVLAGLRAGELLALRWADVDLDRARLEVRDAVVGVPYTAIKPSPEACRARVVDIDPATALLLRMHRDRQQVARADWGNEYSSQDLVICREDGRPLHPRSLDRALTAIAERARVRAVPLAAIRRTWTRSFPRQAALR